MTDDRGNPSPDDVPATVDDPGAAGQGGVDDARPSTRTRSSPTPRTPTRARGRQSSTRTSRAPASDRRPGATAGDGARAPYPRSVMGTELAAAARTYRV